MRSKRSRRNKNKRIAARVIGATIKGTVRMTIITAVSATLLVYPDNIRYTTAYFTSGKVSSEKITFQLVARTQDINALVDYRLGTIAPPVMMYAMGEQAAAPDELFSVIAYISFPVDCGFEVVDIDIRSIELHYNRHTAGVLAGTARFVGSSLVVEFDWDTVEGWLADLEPGESPEFRVTGEGVRAGDGRKFTFSADNIIEINREEMVEITHIEVFGPGDIVIPIEGEGVYDLYQYGFMVFDAEGEEIHGVEVTWSVTGPGVRIGRDGTLTVTPAAVPGAITVVASLKSDDSVQGSLEVNLTAAEEILEEIQPEELLPLELVSGEGLEEQLVEEEVLGEDLPPSEELHPPKEDGEDGGQEADGTGDDTPGEGGDGDAGEDEGDIDEDDTGDEDTDDDEGIDEGYSENDTGDDDTDEDGIDEGDTGEEDTDDDDNNETDNDKDRAEDGAGDNYEPDDETEDEDEDNPGKQEDDTTEDDGSITESGEDIAREAGQGKYVYRGGYLWEIG